jgi:hypothetical protein
MASVDEDESRTPLVVAPTRRPDDPHPDKPLKYIVFELVEKPNSDGSSSSLSLIRTELNSVPNKLVTDQNEETTTLDPKQTHLTMTNLPIQLSREKSMSTTFSGKRTAPVSLRINVTDIHCQNHAIIYFCLYAVNTPPTTYKRSRWTNCSYNVLPSLAGLRSTITPAASRAAILD